MASTIIFLDLLSKASIQSRSHPQALHLNYQEPATHICHTLRLLRRIVEARRRAGRTILLRWYVQGTFGTLSEWRASYLSVPIIRLFIMSPGGRDLSRLLRDVLWPEDHPEREMLTPKSFRYHPVHLGDTMQGGRYKIVHKVGWRHDGTVWLARDTK